VPHLLQRTRPNVKHPPARPAVSHAPAASSLYCMQLKEWRQFPPHALTLMRMRSTHEEMEQRLPCLQLLRLHARHPMLHATVAPACRARTDAVARHMSVDAHASGDRATCLLILHTPASLASHVGTAIPAGTASACVRFLRLLMLQHESTSTTYV
jgi:hypothetical protein